MLAVSSRSPAARAFRTLIREDFARIHHRWGFRAYSHAGSYPMEIIKINNFYTLIQYSLFLILI